MKKIVYLLLAFFALSATFAVQSCNKGETYADMKKKEKKAIQEFLADNDFVGKITVITESQFYANDTITDTARNEFVLFQDDGVYMQIVQRGEGRSMVDFAMEQPDSSISKNILCRFVEYDMEQGDTTQYSQFYPSIVDKMLVSYSHYERKYTGTFTEGLMLSRYSKVVPGGWLKPFNFIRLTRDAGKIAKVRLIVPHASGTSNASTYVLPYYYEISYQLGR